MSTSKKKIGRPSKFNSINKEQLKQLVLDGWTDKKVSAFFGINLSTLTRWKQKHKAFCTTLKDWKSEADVKVEKSLYQRACGYEYKETTIEYVEIGETKTPATKTKEVIKQLPPDPTSMIFWLKNRQPQDWRDKTVIDHNIKEFLHEDLQDKTPEELRKMADDLKSRLNKGSAN